MISASQEETDSANRSLEALHFESLPVCPCVRFQYFGPSCSVPEHIFTSNPEPFSSRALGSVPCVSASLHHLTVCSFSLCIVSTWYGSVCFFSICAVTKRYDTLFSITCYSQPNSDLPGCTVSNGAWWDNSFTRHSFSINSVEKFSHGKRFITNASLMTASYFPVNFVTLWYTMSSSSHVICVVLRVEHDFCWNVIF